MSSSSPFRMSRIALLAASLMGSLVACDIPADESAAEEIDEAAGGLDIAVKPHPMDPAVFSLNLAFTIGPNVMGYAAAAGRDGVIVSESSGGWARSPTDGSVGMTPSIPSNIGSVSKYVSGVALLHLLEKRTEKTLAQWLEEPFYKYLPLTWQGTAHWTVKQIRIKHLLQHQTGINGTFTEDPFVFLQNGVSFSAIGATRTYHNLNYKLLTYLIPVMASPFLQSYNNAYAAMQGVSDDDVRILLGQEYHSIMMNTVLPEMPWAIAPSCRATMDLGNYALAYGSKTDTGVGQVWDSWVQETGCRAQGGWYFSARDLLRFGMAAQNTTALISSTARAQMWSPSSGNDYMVFASVKKYPWMLAELGEDDVPSHGGSHPWAGSTSQAGIVVLPDRTVLVGVVNSPFPGGSQGLRDALVEAYRLSML